MLTMKTSQHDHANPFRPRKVHRASVLRRRGFRPRLEGLEDRTVLSTLTVTNNLDSGTGSLRYAITHAHDGDTIAFAPGLAGQTITLTSDELAIKNSVDIEGPGASMLAVSGSDMHRVFDISEGLTVTIAGLTITHGRTISSQGGGGILNTGSNLTLAGDVLSDNEALNAFAQGGAVANPNHGTLNAIDTMFIGNQALANTPGGLGSGGAIVNGSEENKSGGIATITGCTFTGNRAVGGDGGVVIGLFEIGAAYGGGIHNQTGSTLTVTDSFFTGNQAIAGNGGSGGKFSGHFPAVVDVALGGGIGSADGAVQVVRGSTFSYNLAVGGSNASGSTGGPGRVGNGTGGGLGSVGAATVMNSSFDHNEALGGSDDSGGGGLTFVGRGIGGGISSSVFTTPSSLTVSNCIFTNNQAVGGARDTGDTTSGDGLGGGLANFLGSTVTITNCTFLDNQAMGGAGEVGANGNNGFGGGVYNDGQSTLTLTGSTITGNQAIGGPAGTGGSAGLGEGGGLYLADGGVACLDTFTQAHTTINQATTDHDDILGSFMTC
jgi:hypothetical protein